MSDSRAARVPERAAGEDAAVAAPPMVACELRESSPAPTPSRDFLTAGNPRPVLRAALDCSARGSDDAVLALVLEADGSTYAQAGAMALFAGDTQVGWLSGGCLEPELARRAARAAADARLGWIEIDTRDDAALLSGGALGCRGRLRIALLPLRAMRGAEALFARWLKGGATLERAVDTDGHVSLRIGDARATWALPCDAPEWARSDSARDWPLPLPRPPEALLCGAGPETPLLVGLLRDLGWRVSVAEDRPRWRDAGAHADVRIDAMPVNGTRTEGEPTMRAAQDIADAALVMHHAFERDLETLIALASTRVPFIGLLGPPRRRDDLLKLLDPAARAALAQRLRAPVGLDLGGQGPEAIALSIAAQLQGWRASAHA